MQSSSIKGLFKDKTTLILRAMLEDPEKAWKVRELAVQCDVSLGLVSRCAGFLYDLGIAQIEIGRRGYIQLVKTEAILEEWVLHYDFSLNALESFYSANKNILPKLKLFLNKKGWSKDYALTLHCGANFLTNYVRDENVYLYCSSKIFQKVLQETQDRLGFKKLVEGGNIHFVQPYYKNSVMYGKNMIGGYPVVSNLQLYLDLYHFSPRGREHADYLRNFLASEKKSLWDL